MFGEAAPPESGQNADEADEEDEHDEDSEPVPSISGIISYPYLLIYS